METYSRLFGIASLFALEVGGRVRRMHVQGILRCKCIANEEGKKILNDHIKAFMPIPRGSGGYVECKPLEQGQIFTYCWGTVKSLRMKDRWVNRRLAAAALCCLAFCTCSDVPAQALHSITALLIEREEAIGACHTAAFYRVASAFTLVQSFLACWTKVTLQVGVMSPETP